jgi:hypothetical protein
VKKIEHISLLENLETFWICENQISAIENLPKSIKSFWAGNNLITNLDNNILNYKELSDLNISGNLINSLQDIFILSKLTSLKLLSFNDPNFGDNPICSINYYRIFIISHLPFLQILDEIRVTEDEKKEIDTIYKKKNLYYRNRIKTYHNISKSLFNLMKSAKNFYMVFKNYRMNYLYKRVKLLEYLKDKEGQSAEEIEKEITNIQNYIEKCYKNIGFVKKCESEIKAEIENINDFMIVK